MPRQQIAQKRSKSFSGGISTGVSSIAEKEKSAQERGIMQLA